MKNRSPIAVALLPIVTFGIYQIFWYVDTKEEMNAHGADIPTAWLLIVPLANIYWVWKYCGGVEKVTNAKYSQVLAFILLYLIGSIGAAIIQDAFNKAGAPAMAPAAASPMSAAAPAVPEVPSAPTGPTPPTAPTV
ncbi:MAG: DUF4234 domain-containing protein [Candidatus Saccharibacteria bacterium]|nr:DUF4234 domain-containing protein [Candidatus Saccharibacteria bacterium]